MKIHFIQHATFEYPGYLIDWAKQRGYETGCTKVYEELKFPQPEAYDILIIMGGPMGAYEEEKYEWLKAEKKFIKSNIDKGKKVLGICLGSQLVAEALGAKVFPHSQKEIGWWPVKKNENNKHHPLIKNLPDEFETFHWHGDTFELPEDALQLFRSGACEQQGFVYSNHVAGIQFHMEVKEDLLVNMTDHDRSELVPGKYIQSEKMMYKKMGALLSKQHDYIAAFADAFTRL